MMHCSRIHHVDARRGICPARWLQPGSSCRLKRHGSTPVRHASSRASFVTKAAAQSPDDAAGEPNSPPAPTPASGASPIDSSPAAPARPSVVYVVVSWLPCLGLPCLPSSQTQPCISIVPTPTISPSLQPRAGLEHTFQDCRLHAVVSSTNVHPSRSRLTLLSHAMHPETSHPSRCQYTFMNGCQVSQLVMIYTHA